MKIEITTEELEQLLNTKPEEVEKVCGHPGDQIVVRKFYVCLECSEVLEAKMVAD